jgi:uncharacterized protein YdbL (DUF1318 family)
MAITAGAREAGADEVASALIRFRAAVATMAGQQAMARAPETDFTRGIWLAYLDASREMFAWASRRAKI